MQFEPEESGEERRRRQRDYHAFLDAQVEARKQQAPEDDAAAAADRLPALPLSARSKIQSSTPYGTGSATSFARRIDKDLVLDDSGGVVSRDLDHRAEIAFRNEQLSRMEQRIDAQVQRKLGALSEEVRDKTRHLDAELTRMRDWQHRVEATISLTPKVQEMTQQQIKALEDEARTRITADEGRSARFHRAVERVSAEVENLARRLEAEESDTLQRMNKIEATFAVEAKGAREATKQLGAQVKALDSEVMGSEDKIDSLLESCRILEKRQKEQHSAAADAKSARHEAEQLREQVHALSAAVSGSESKMATLLQTVRGLEARRQSQQSTGAEQADEQVSRQQMQESLMAAMSLKLGLLRTSIADELSGLMGDTAKRAVESTNVPHLITALRGRVELAEERLNNMADKSFGALEHELTGVRAEMTRLEGRIETGPVAAGLKALAGSTTAAQTAVQSQLTELQDALSAEITARRRNAVRLAEAQAAASEGGRESAVQAASGLRARCLELEELVVRLTKDVQIAKEDLSSQTQIQLAATQERNSRAVGKLEESLAALRVQLVQQGTEEDRNCAKVAARVDELEGLISGNKDLLREAEERARQAFAAIEAKRQEQAKQFIDKVDGVESEETTRIEAVELALREQGHNLKEAIETGHRASRRRFDDVNAEVKSLEGRMRTIIADSQEDVSARIGSLLQQAQEQVDHHVARIRQVTDRVTAETNTLREKINTEELSRMTSTQDLYRDLSNSTEASLSHIRLWAEDRLRNERVAVEESIKRAEGQGEMVRTLLDEAVKAVSKELEILRSDSAARNTALEESMDERALDLETRLTEIDNATAKKRRVSELTKETGARIGEIERRVLQAERELKDDLEVKLAVSSLVCTVADRASTQNSLERASSEDTRLENVKLAGVVEGETNLRAELKKTNKVVENLRADFNATRERQTGADSLQLKLMAQIEELRAIAEAAEATAETAKTDALAAREVEAKYSKALEDAAKSTAVAEATQEGKSAAEPPSDKKAEAANGMGGEQGKPFKKTPTKKMDFAALNDELEAGEEGSPSPPSSGTRSSEDSAREKDANCVGDESALKPRVSEIEQELAQLKQRLEYGIAAMDSLRRELLGAGSSARALPHPQSDPTFSLKGGGSDKERQNPSSNTSSRVHGGKDGEGEQGQGVDADEASASAGSDEENRAGNDRGAPGKESQGNDSGKRPRSPVSASAGRRTPSSGASYTPPLSPTSDQAFAQSERGLDEGERSGSDGETSSGGSGRDSEAEEGHSRSPSSADEVELASRRGEEDSQKESETGSVSSASEDGSPGGLEDGDDGSNPRRDGSGVSDQVSVSERSSGKESGRSRRANGGGVRDGRGDDGSSSGSETEGSATPRALERSRSGGGEEEGEDDGHGDDRSSSETEGSDAPRESSRGSEEGEDDSRGDDGSGSETEGSATPEESERSQSSATGRGEEGEDDSRGDDGSGSETVGSITPGASERSRSSARGSEEEGDDDSRADGDSGSETEGSVTPRGSDHTQSSVGESEEERDGESTDAGSDSSRLSRSTKDIPPR